MRWLKDKRCKGFSGIIKLRFVKWLEILEYLEYLRTPPGKVPRYAYKSSKYQYFPSTRIEMEDI